jgi:sodium/potassium-transporting ATPase subunit alpha
MPFNSQVKFALTIVEEPSEGSYYTIYMKGAPEKIWTYCSSVVKDNKPSPIEATW